jgi:hypothetical protein
MERIAQPPLNHRFRNKDHIPENVLELPFYMEGRAVKPTLLAYVEPGVKGPSSEPYEYQALFASLRALSCLPLKRCVPIGVRLRWSGLQAYSVRSGMIRFQCGFPAVNAPGASGTGRGFCEPELNDRPETLGFFLRG